MADVRISPDLLRLQRELSAEASSAPKLFADLARVEEYLAETYKSRSLIELIQNADDAQATLFGIHQHSHFLVIGNNGRPFTATDLEALCRSGASQKQRGTGTIGYRGVGFKSVANLASEIYLKSGEFFLAFDRIRTCSLLGCSGSVPLVRIPHPVSFPSHELEELIANFGQTYGTIFVFDGIEGRLADEELNQFDAHSLLFLNHVRGVNVHHEARNETVRVERGEAESRTIWAGNRATQWKVLADACGNAVACKLNEDGHIVPAELEESVIHSFTPTNEFPGAFLKLNGDYSTDPSRKSIDWDQLSEEAFNGAVAIISSAALRALDGVSSLKGFFAPLVASAAGGTTRRKFVQALASHLTPLKRHLLPPDWLNFDDYAMLCGEFSVSRQTVVDHPEIIDFLDLVGCSKMNLDAALERVGQVRMSPLGYAQVAAKVVNQKRYDLTAANIRLWASLPLFPRPDGAPVTAARIKSIESADPGFARFLSDNTDPRDLFIWLEKMGVAPGLPEVQAKNAADRPQHAQVAAEPREAPRALPPGITRWRSAERNALEFFRSLDGVLDVSDVSAANMGYDLEIVLATGRKLLVEVKSVKGYGDPVRLTNNEYASAHSAGDSYLLAVVINGDRFALRTVSDPIRRLVFEKQIDRWSWVCGTYASLLATPELPLFPGEDGDA